jgi:CheY-like chemotaxis protein
MEMDMTPDGTELQGARILVVDDEEDTRLFVQTLLEDEGAEVRLADGGEEGLALARAESFDIMTLDLSMPGMNGVELFTELRKTPELQDLPICIVTGHAELRGTLYERSVKVPEGFLNKPVDPATLVSTLRRILDLRERRSTRG